MNNYIVRSYRNVIVVTNTATIKHRVVMYKNAKNITK